MKMKCSRSGTENKNNGAPTAGSLTGLSRNRCLLLQRLLFLTENFELGAKSHFAYFWSAYWSLKGIVFTISLSGACGGLRKFFGINFALVLCVSMSSSFLSPLCDKTHTHALSFDILGWAAISLITTETPLKLIPNQFPKPSST